MKNPFVKKKSLKKDDVFSLRYQYTSVGIIVGIGLGVVLATFFENNLLLCLLIGLVGGAIGAFIDYLLKKGDND